MFGSKLLSIKGHFNSTLIVVPFSRRSAGRWSVRSLSRITMSSKSSAGGQVKGNVVPLYLLNCGSFNPITNMHLRMFELAKDYVLSDECRKRSGLIYGLIKGYISPVHDGYGQKKNLVAGVHRKRMVELALEGSGVDWIKCDDWEMRQPSWPLWVEVLQHYQEEFNKNHKSDSVKPRIMILCGADLVATFGAFKQDGSPVWSESDIKMIVGDFGLLVITRNGTDMQKLIDSIDVLKKLEGNIHVIEEWCPNEVSATKIREAVEKNLSMKYLVQDAVIKYIQENKLYVS